LCNYISKLILNCESEKLYDKMFELRRDILQEMPNLNSGVVDPSAEPKTQAADSEGLPCVHGNSASLPLYPPPALNRRPQTNSPQPSLPPATIQLLLPSRTLELLLESKNKCYNLKDIR
jgi:hypothetical protein